MKRFVMVVVCSLAAVAICLAAESTPSHLRLWHTGDFTALDGRLKTQIPSGQNFAITDVDSFGKHKMRFVHLEGNGNAELRENTVVFYIVQDGDGTVVNGGKLLNPTPRPDDPQHSWRGTGIEGGQAYAVKRGDVVKFPNGEAHQILVAPGHTLKMVSFVISVE